jgi:hypothetical protein
VAPDIDDKLRRPTIQLHRGDAPIGRTITASGIANANLRGSNKSSAWAIVALQARYHLFHLKATVR